MKFSFTTKILLATLTFCIAIEAPIVAQTYPGTGYSQPPSLRPSTSYSQPNPTVYPGITNTPSIPNVYPNPSYSQPNPGVYPVRSYPPYRQPTSTAFVCGRVGVYPATLVQSNGRTLQSPLIVFQTASDRLTPEQRCQDVSQRMTKAVTQNGGKLSNLLLTTGKVNGQAVICFVNTAEACNSSNVVLTLVRRENAKNPGKVLARIVRFGRAGGGSNVLEAGGVEGEDDIIPQSVSLEQAVNELASESGRLESGGTDSSYNENPTNLAPDPNSAGDSSI